MNRLEQFVHKLVGDYPMLRIPLVTFYQRACSIFPSKNFEASTLIENYPGYFFGFHDKVPWSYDNSKLLAHHFDFKKKISQLESESIEVGYFEDGKYRFVGNTNAWNWQQGATLQWLGRSNKIVYNDVDQGKAIARLVDLETGNREVIQRHIMAVSGDGKLGLSCSFSRLGRGMPGYGYSTLEDRNENDMLPSNEGFTINNLKDNTCRQIISLSEIVDIESNNLMRGAYHFFSHCLFSPDNKRFVFFHRFLRNNGSLETRMFSSDLDGGNIWQFPGEKFSHIAWSSDSTILTYCKPRNKKIGFYFLEEFTGKVTAIVNQDITSDGHPQVSNDGKYVLIDTYPDRCRNQRLMLYDIEKNNIKLLVKYKIPFKYRLERRCDFHPRWNRDSTLICYDSVHKNVRSLSVIRNPDPNISPVS